jgi:putative nucleotidyltransferase with HDIG domain
VANHLDQPFLQFVEAMAEALDARDPYTAGHSIRVAEYSRRLARELGLDSVQIETVYVAAHLHDIGKIGTPDTVLQKRGKLTKEEFDIIKLHPGVGKRILSKVAGFETYLNVVELHHENVDGTGYPHGLQGEKIPLDARIVRVADAFDAMTSDRAYRPSLTRSQALDQIRMFSGKQFDARVAEAFLKLAKDDLEILPPACLANPVPVEMASLQRLKEALAELEGVETPPFIGFSNHSGFID